MINRVRLLLINLFELLISLAILASIVPALATLLIFAELIRSLVSKILQVVFKGKVELMAGTDAIWEFRKPLNSRNILIPVICRQEIDPIKYASDFQDKILNYRDQDGNRPYHKFTKIAIKKLGYYCWMKDDKFDVKNHIRVLLPGSGSDSDSSDQRLFTESDLMELLTDLNEDMDDSKPQWEEVIIPRFCHEGAVKCLRIFRFHHGYMDGASYLLMTGQCVTDQLTSFPYPFSIDEVLLNPKRSYWKSAFYYANCFIYGPIQAVKTLYMCQSIQNRFVARDFTGRTNFEWSRKINVKAMKAIRAQTGASVPCIMTTITAGGISRFLKASPGDFGDGQKEEFLVGFVNLITPFPNLVPQNRFTVTHLNLAVEEGLKPASRLGIMQKLLKSLYTSPNIHLNFWFLSIVGRLPAFLIQNCMVNSGSPAVLSNVPWATSQVKIFGNEVEDTGAWTPLLTFSGLGILFMSYNGFTRICISAQEAVLTKEELRQFLEALEAEVEEFGRHFHVTPMESSFTLDLDPEASNPPNFLTRNSSSKA